MLRRCTEKLRPTPSQVKQPAAAAALQLVAVQQVPAAGHVFGIFCLGREALGEATRRAGHLLQSQGLQLYACCGRAAGAERGEKGQGRAARQSQAQICSPHLGQLRTQRAALPFRWSARRASACTAHPQWRVRAPSQAVRACQGAAHLELLGVKHLRWALLPTSWRQRVPGE